MNAKSESRTIGTFTVLDIMVFVAACSISIVFIRLLRPPSATIGDYLYLTAACGPAGLALMGPWAVRRQFLESGREELWPGEWLWITLAGTWMAVIPLAFFVGGSGISFVASLLAIVLLIPALVALLQCFSRPFHKPWTHWAGIVLCLLHAGPALAQVGPVFWRSLDSVCEFLGIFLN